MGRVVGRDAVDGAVGERLDHRLDVALGAEGRGHLGVRVVGLHRVVRQQQVMRRDLGRHAHAARLGVPQHAHRPGRRDVGDVEMRAGQLRQHDVARNHDLLGGGRLTGEAQLRGDDALVHDGIVRQVAVLGMADDRRAEGQRVLHRAAIQLGVHHAPAVVGERHASGFRLLRQAFEKTHPGLAERLGVGHDMSLRYRHEIGCIEELAERDLMLDRPAPRLAQRTGAHRALLVGEAHDGYWRRTSTKPCGPKGGA